MPDSAKQYLVPNTAQYITPDGAQCLAPDGAIFCDGNRGVQIGVQDIEYQTFNPVGVQIGVQDIEPLRDEMHKN